MYKTLTKPTLSTNINDRLKFSVIQASSSKPAVPSNSITTNMARSVGNVSPKKKNLTVTINGGTSGSSKNNRSGLHSAPTLPNAAASIKRNLTVTVENNLVKKAKPGKFAAGMVAAAAAAASSSTVSAPIISPTMTQHMNGRGLVSDYMIVENDVVMQSAPLSAQLIHSAPIMDVYHHQQHPQHPQQHQQQEVNKDRPTCIVIENLHYEATEKDIEETFKAYGRILRCKLIYDRSGRSTGKAEITFDQRSAALSVIEKFDGTVADGQTLRVYEQGGATGIKLAGSTVTRGRGGANGKMYADKIEQVAEQQQQLQQQFQLQQQHQQQQQQRLFLAEPTFEPTTYIVNDQYVAATPVAVFNPDPMMMQQPVNMNNGGHGGNFGGKWKNKGNYNRKFRRY